MEQSWNTSQPGKTEPTKAANTLTYAQRKKMQSREKVQDGNVDLQSETLDPAYADKLRQGRSKPMKPGWRSCDR
eukprot:817280-Karenia_brevis.AAC.1